jgi:hypothetical protein
MTTVLGKGATTTNGAPLRPPATSTRLPVPRVVRRPALAVVSAAVVVASVATFVSIYSGANHQVPVLTIVRPVEQGQTIVAGDLGEAGITSQGDIAVVPAASSSDVVGKVATVPLTAGTLLTMADLSNGQVIAPGDAVVGIALKDGQLPSAGLQPGNDVMVVQTAAPGAAVPASTGTVSTSGSGTDASAGSSPGAASAGGQTGVLVPEAVVREVAQPSTNASNGETELVSVEVSDSLAAVVSVAAAAGQVSLVLLPPEGGKP